MFIVIHGRRQISTTTRPRNAAVDRCRKSCQSDPANGAGTGTSTRSASVATTGPTSLTDRGDIECMSRPAALQGV